MTSLRLLVLATVLVPTTAVAGAWVTPQDEVYLNVSGWTASTRSRFDFDGDEQELADRMRFEERALGGYAAVGLAPGVELNASVLVKFLELESTVDRVRTTGLADLTMGLKIGLGGEDLVRSIQVAAKIPTGYEDATDLPLGDGQIDLEVRALVGASLWKLDVPGYVGLEAAYRVREGEPGDVMAFLAEAGVNVFEDAGLRIKLDVTEAVDLPRETSPERELFAYDSRLSRLDLTVWLGLARVASLEVTHTVVLDARNYTGGDAWRIGLARTFRATP